MDLKNDHLRDEHPAEQIEKEQNYLPSFLHQETFHLPVITIDADPDDLFSEEKGIYVMGKKAEGNFPYHKANFWKDKEIPIQFTFYESDKKIGFQMNAGMEIFGGVTRTLPQRSLAIFAKEKYGAKKINYQLFPNIQLDTFDSIVLRNSGQDFAKTHLLDGFISILIQEMNVDVQAYRPVTVYLNKQYWGIYNLREKISLDFLVDHHQLSSKRIDLLESDMKVKKGDAEAYKELVQYLMTADPAKKETMDYIHSQLDLDNFIDYHIAQLYIANTDWPWHNIRYWRPKEEGAKWRWIVYDNDLSFYDPSINSIEKNLNYTGKKHEELEKLSIFILKKLLENEQFQKQFLQKFAYHLDKTFEYQHVLNTLQATKNRIEPEMDRHLQRWGGSKEEWYKEIEVLKNFAQERPHYIRRYIQDYFKLSEQEMRELGFDTRG